jgi:hypothetical protein
VRVFISYRRTDAPSASRQLAEALKLRFGEEDVFFDTRDVAAGTEWRRDAVRRVQESDVVLAIIGPHWAAVAEERAQRRKLDPTVEDVVRLEIETAFADKRPIIPVLVDDAEMPPREALPGPFRWLARVQAQTLRHATWDRDVEALADALPHILESFQEVQPPPEPVARSSVPAARTDTERIASYLAERSVVTVLGSGANAVDRDGPWQHGAGSLPSASELARHLARNFDMRPESDDFDLARVSEHVSLTEGKAVLYRILRELLVKAECEPSSLLRFVARLPGRLRDLGRERYQLVVTANYDAALERAFDALHEPYELVVFVAAGDHRGRFVHVPWWDPEARGYRPITVPNEYVDLPIDEDGALERTVIVKLHGGGVDLGPGGPRDNFVITEDDYIGYLTQSPVASLIPLQILNKIRESHFLFLGYRMSDWTLRVFLQRIWGEQQVDARSWALEGPGLDDVERELWDHFGVHVIEQDVVDFLNELERELGRLAGTHVER